MIDLRSRSECTGTTLLLPIHPLRESIHVIFTPEDRKEERT